jgi:hypothetical protein
VNDPFMYGQSRSVSRTFLPVKAKRPPGGGRSHMKNVLGKHVTDSFGLQTRTAARESFPRLGLGARPEIKQQYHSIDRRSAFG